MPFAVDHYEKIDKLYDFCKDAGIDFFTEKDIKKIYPYVNGEYNYEKEKNSHKNIFMREIIKIHYNLYFTHEIFQLFEDVILIFDTTYDIKTDETIINNAMSKAQVFEIIEILEDYSNDLDNLKKDYKNHLTTLIQ